MGRTHVRRSWGRNRIRRRRAAALGVVLSLALLIPVGRALGSQPTPRVGEQAGGSAYVVRPGDTVWDIARGIVGPQGDPRPLVDAIASANGLSGAAIVPGQVLEIPAPAG